MDNIPQHCRCHRLLWFNFVLLFSLIGYSTHSQATSPLEGLWRVKGIDAQLGSYSGYLELRERANNNTLDVIRMVRLDSYPRQDGRSIELVWTGTATPVKTGGVQLAIALTRADFITQVGNLKRSLEDSMPLWVSGDVQVNGNSLALRYIAKKDSHFMVNETASQRAALPSQPIWQAQRFERETHAELVPFKLDESLKFLWTVADANTFLDINALQADPHGYLFTRFADYQALPALAPYVNNPIFQRAVHRQIIDRTDFDYYQQNPNRLRVVNKVVDAISLAETEVRANAFRSTPNDKATFYQEGLNREFVGAHGMVVRGIDSLGQEQPDNDGALWTGVYVYTQALRYKLSAQEDALNNVRRSLTGLLTLMDITGDSAQFARTLRSHLANVAPPWHAGTGASAQFDWLEGGNNDMAKGLVLGMSAAWEVLPKNDSLRDAISSHARKLLDLDQFQLEKGENAAMAYLFAGITNNSLIADIRKGTGQTLLRVHLLEQYARSGGGAFYLFGISDWSGNHLTLTSALSLQLLLQHTNSTDLQILWQQAPAIAWNQSLRNLDHPIHAAQAISAGSLDSASQREAIEQIRWALRAFPYPKHPYPVDHRLQAEFVMSPFPVLPWKQDYLSNPGRQQAIRAYPLFEQSIDEYRWNNLHFSIAEYGLGDVRVPGVDYLFLYWSARNAEVECLFNWAARAYPTLFLPFRPVSRFLAPFVYRYYPETKTILSVSATTRHVFYQQANGTVQDVGHITPWLALAGCQ